MASYRDNQRADLIKRDEGNAVRDSFHGNVPSPRPDMSIVTPIMYGARGLIFPVGGKHGGKYGANGVVYVDTFRKIVAFFGGER